MSSGLIARYYFDVRHARERAGEREESAAAREGAGSHFTEHEPRLYSRNNAKCYRKLRALETQRKRGMRSGRCVEIEKAAKVCKNSNHREERR